MNRQGVSIDVERFKKMKASEQRLVLYNNINSLNKIKFQIKLQWMWLGALTTGCISFAVWAVNNLFKIK